MARRKRGNPVNGWVILDKPLGMSSTQAVGKVRWLLTAQKAGHGGTLDPLASGILPIALGEATKTMPFTVDATKTYRFSILWGANTDTWDAEGQVTETSDIRLAPRDIEAVLSEFTGHISQIPPRYSAIKVAGKRAYDLARAGEDVVLKSRNVHVQRLSLIDATPEIASFEMDCGKGTYVRALARDLAARLGTCGHVSFLRRTRVGRFDETRAFSLDALEKLCHRGDVLEALCPVETALDDIPVLAVTDQDVKDLKQGRVIVCPPSFIPKSTEAQHAPWILAKDGDLAIALCHWRDGVLAPKRVFNL